MDASDTTDGALLEAFRGKPTSIERERHILQSIADGTYTGAYGVTSKS